MTRVLGSLSISMNLKHAAFPDHNSTLENKFSPLEFLLSKNRSLNYWNFFIYILNFWINSCKKQNDLKTKHFQRQNIDRPASQPASQHCLSSNQSFYLKCKLIPWHFKSDILYEKMPLRIKFLFDLNENRRNMHNQQNFFDF